MVILRNVSKRFGNTVAVDSLSLEIPSGQVLGLLGENGAGKTTLMNILAGYLPATSGDVSINGADMLSHPLAARSAVGYMPEQVPVYPELTVLEYLDYCCALKNVGGSARNQTIQEIAAMADIGDALHKRISTLSKGMKQRVGFAQALCGDPQLLLLDEPTAGFDPTQAADFRPLVRSLANTHTVVVSSHILSEIEAMCDRVCIMKSGRVVYDQPVHPVNGATGSAIRLVIGGRNAAFLPSLRLLPSVRKVTLLDADVPDQLAVLAAVDDTHAFGRELATLVSGMELSILSLTPVERTLEDIFLNVSRADQLPTGACVS